MKPRSTTGARAVLRALALLRAFRDDTPELGLTALARATGLHKTTAFRILGELEREGMVARNAASGAYRLGPGAIVLGARALRSNALRRVARVELERLAERSGETATLEVLVSHDTLILDEVTSRYVVGTLPDVGTRWPAHATSTGKALLAALLQAGAAVPLLGGGRLRRFTPRTITSSARLRAELERTWRRGYAQAIEELELGFVAVGAAIYGSAGQAVAALSVGGPKSRLRRRSRLPELGALVREAAQRVSALLGGEVRPGC